MDRVTKGERWSEYDTRRVGVNVVQKKGGRGGGMVEWVRHEEGGGECGAEERGEEGLGGEGREFVFMGFSF